MKWKARCRLLQYNRETIEVHLKEKAVLMSAVRNAPQKKLIQGTYGAANENSSKWAIIKVTNKYWVRLHDLSTLFQIITKIIMWLS